MLRLPWFEHRAPRSIAEAAKILADEGPRAMLIAGGTDLLPNMKRRHQAPQVLVSLRQVSELRRLNGSFGAGLTLTEVVRSVLRFEPDDELDLTDKIVSLLAHPALRRQLSAAGLREVKKVRWERPARALRGIYDELVAAAP